MVNKSFEFNLPTRIICGIGAIEKTGEEVLNMKKNSVLIITDKGLVNAGIADKLLDILKSSGIKKIKIFDQVIPNPKDETVQKAYEITKQEDIDVIIALGGGSAMDTSKGVGLLMTNDGDRINDFEDPDKIVNRSAPVIAIPTTVGTGSEVTFWSVITDTNRMYKMGIGSVLIGPALAIVDPDLVESLPAAIVASTGIDALTHAIEAYTCRASEPIADALALYAIELISENIRSAAYGDSYEARSNMLIASMIAGISFGQTGIAAVHCMAESLGGLYDIPHGVANAILLPYVMEFNCAADLKKAARITKALGENIAGLTDREAAIKGVEAVKILNQDLDIPKLKDIGIKKENLEELAERSAQNVSVPDNIRKITKGDFLMLLEKALEA